MKPSKTPADLDRRAEVTVDAIDVILARWSELELPVRDSERVARG